MSGMGGGEEYCGAMYQAKKEKKPKRKSFLLTIFSARLELDPFRGCSSYLPGFG
jgi:hypothetical protein